MSRLRACRTCSVVLLWPVTVSLAGCGVSSTEEIKVWIEKEHKLLGTAATPIVATRSFVPQAYTVVEKSDPFDMSRVNGVDVPVVDKVQSSNKALGSAPDLSGPKQALENFPLESLQVKGILSQEGIQLALVWVGDRLHQVRQGDYMGMHRGKVLEISPTSLVVSERELDASGQWKSKNTVLPVKQGEK